MSDIVYLFVAYLIISTGIFVYVFKLQKDQKKMKREIRMLKEVVNERRERRE